MKEGGLGLYVVVVRMFGRCVVVVEGGGIGWTVEWEYSVRGVDCVTWFYSSLLIGG